MVRIQEKGKGGERGLQEKYKPANNKGAVRTASAVFNYITTKFVVARTLANRRPFLRKSHLNEIDISMCEGRYLLIAVVTKKYAVIRSFEGSCETRYHENK